MRSFGYLAAKDRNTGGERTDRVRMCSTMPSPSQKARDGDGATEPQTVDALGFVAAGRFLDGRLLVFVNFNGLVATTPPAFATPLRRIYNAPCEKQIYFSMCLERRDPPKPRRA